MYKYNKTLIFGYAFLGRARLGKKIVFSGQLNWFLD